MSGRECYHCKQWIDEGEAHDCWTTTEQALTHDLAEDLRDAWERLREAMLDLGEQRVYASGTCIMFSRQVCHVFVRPKRKVLEVCIFLARALADPRVRRADRSSKVKFANIVHLTHRDEVEPPLTDWLREAYLLQDTVAVAARTADPQEPGRSPQVPRVSHPGRPASDFGPPVAHSMRHRAPAGRNESCTFRDGAVMAPSEVYR